MNLIKYFMTAFLFLVAETSAGQAEVSVDAQVWVDNWYAVYANGHLVTEDPEPFTRERSFNAESFSFTTRLPSQIALVIRDYMENDSGLEYIGSRRQQMGDGGFIAQFRDAESGQFMAVSDDS